MGELIRRIGNISIHDTNYEIELNGSACKNGPQMIHIQSPAFRFECETQYFLKICATVLFAEKNLKSYKGIYEDDL